MSARSMFWSVRTTQGSLNLCSACFAVLVQEGTLAGDPKEEAIPASDVLRASPLTSGPARCDVCTTREAHELHRPVLRAPPARLGTFRACPERCDASACRESCAG